MSTEEDAMKAWCKGVCLAASAAVLTVTAVGCGFSEILGDTEAEELRQAEAVCLLTLSGTNRPADQDAASFVACVLVPNMIRNRHGQ